MREQPVNVRDKIAREAANLLYCDAEKEFKQAKLKAAKMFNSSFLPTNAEVALELDRIAEEHEGSARLEHLVRMRREALSLMKALKLYRPLLVGSVWRGTAHKHSDIDIAVYCDEPEAILNNLKRCGIKVLRTEWVAVTKKGERKKSFHIHVKSPLGDDVEIKVRSLEEAGMEDKCEIYGDKITGLDVNELERLLKANPTKRFLPS